MKVVVRIRDAAITVDVGPGHQRLKWLALVALQRYREAAVPEPYGGVVMLGADSITYSSCRPSNAANVVNVARRAHTVARCG